MKHCPNENTTALTPEILDKLHQTGQEVLDAFVRICEENHLRYYLYYGTLLGAVRHKGPIPWDDDVDVVMPRGDMEKFRALMLARPAGETYYISGHKDDPKPFRAYLRLHKSDAGYKVDHCGKRLDPWVDIFPLDDASNCSGAGYAVRCRYITTLKGLAYNKSLRSVKGLGIKQQLKHILLRPVSYEWLCRLIEAEMCRSNGKSCINYASWTSTYPCKKEVVPKDWFEPAAEVEYGGKRYRAPKEWDKLLTQIYGDYMIPPPSGGPPQTRQSDRDEALVKEDRDAGMASGGKTPITPTPEQMEKIHQAGQELLDVFVRICRENHLRYYLYYGTLLGAVRHKGPIPWDDDMDVAMPREDMEKFRALMLARPAGEQYQIDCWETDPGLWVPFIRLRKKDTVFVAIHDLRRDMRFFGLWLDVFPLDDIPYTAGPRHKLYGRYVAFQKRLVSNKAFVSTDGMRWTGKTVHMLLWPFPYERLHGWLEKSMRWWEGRGCKAYVSWTSAYPYWKETVPKDWYEPAAEVEYGGKRYRAPKEWDKLLTQIYGDYMTPPPPEAQVGHSYPVRIEL